MAKKKSGSRAKSGGIKRGGSTAKQRLKDLRVKDASGIRGGDVTVNKAKTADKAFSAMDGYVRGSSSASAMVNQRKDGEMTAKKTGTGKGQAKKLKLKKETVKDLDVKGKANGVKGGVFLTGMCTNRATCVCGTEATCLHK